MSMVGAFLVLEARMMATFNPEIPRDRRTNLLNDLTKGMDNDPNEIKVGKWVYGASSSILVTFTVERGDDRQAVPEKPSSPEPSKLSTASVKLERDKCAVVLEAVKACEVLRDCSEAGVDKHFAPQKASFDAMAGATVFTVAKLNAQCREVCLQKTYKLGPARERLCGY